MGQQNYYAGHEAERVAAVYLENRGYRIHELNWRTPVCEIDIVAEKSQKMYFVEVKYRQNDNQGDGLDYITPKKLQQMRYAAQCWVQKFHYEGDYEISAIEITNNFQITEFIETIDWKA